MSVHSGNKKLLAKDNIIKTELSHVWESFISELYDNT